MNRDKLNHLADIIERVQQELRAATPTVAPCGYVNRAGDVKECAPDHDTADDIRARIQETGGYVMQPSSLPTPVGLNWHGSDYRLLRGEA